MYGTAGRNRCGIYREQEIRAETYSNRGVTAESNCLVWHQMLEDKASLLVKCATLGVEEPRGCVMVGIPAKAH